MLQLNPTPAASIPWVNAKEYSSLNTAVTAIGSANKTLLISDGAPLTAALNVPSNVSLEFLGGGVITLGNYDLTIYGNVEAGSYKIFDCQIY